MGIKSLECNFNPRNRTYNPHLHLLVPNQEIAEILIKEWQAKWTSQYTSPLAQHKRRVTNLERDLVETIKYGSKIFTDFDALQKGRIPQKIYLAAFENIYRAMKLYRLFDRFGFNLAKTEKISVTTEVLAAQRNEYIFTAGNITIG